MVEKDQIFTDKNYRGQCFHAEQNSTSRAAAYVIFLSLFNMSHHVILIDQ